MEKEEIQGLKVETEETEEIQIWGFFFFFEIYFMFIIECEEVMSHNSPEKTEPIFDLI